MTDENLIGNEQAKDEREEVYYEGSPSLWGSVGQLLLCVLLAMGSSIGAFALAGHGWYIPVFGLLVAAALIIVPVLLVRSTHYRVTSYRIDFERGLFSKDIDTLELWHVEDIKFHQSFLDRLLGVGQIIVLAHDDTTPELQLQSLPDPRPVFDALKQRIITVKRQRGVIKIDAG
ncbi:MAG: PH domain-containing protein [Kiritimatiellaeota bacterium]|nr:PH domain-containing protein [Kiritimatiellota bacterium]